MVVTFFWQANDSYLLHYESIKEPKDELYTSILGLRFRVQHEHFRRGAIRIKCTSKVLDHDWQVQKTITHQNFQRQLGPSQYGPSKGSSVSCLML